MKLKTIKMTVLGIVALSAIGCSGFTSDSPNTTTSSGIAFDWYVKDAIVFADFNKDGIRDAIEPFTTTDDKGAYSLIVDAALGTDYIVVVKGGTDIATEQPFTGILKTDPKNSVASSITTLIEEFKIAGIKNPEAAVRKFLELDSSVDLLQDPAKNPVLYRSNLKINAFLQTLSQGYSKAISTSSPAARSARTLSASQISKLQFVMKKAIEALTKVIQANPNLILSATPENMATLVEKINEEVVKTLSDDPAVIANFKEDFKTISNDVFNVISEIGTLVISTAPTLTNARQQQIKIEGDIKIKIQGISISTPINVEIPIDAPILTGAGS